ncbi:Excinuclease ABC subunit A [Weissella viridescens]|uniref:UvrABC system protein A n=1 Tax=Weissella viridescens TaxID=1629 RepID=A0A380NZ23_WEIVI|nr:Excinuclease ABC subunit A [Weissella viridescens]
MLAEIRDIGNTVLVVEHDPDVIKIADYIVDVGPHAGVNGGEIMYTGSYAGLLESDTLTGRSLKLALPFKETPRPAERLFKLKPAHCIT